ncbi:MAG: class I SAM-dependent methyltransferase, partial [Proteobacteria bacterium]|nr:class I SAM-dependent methyltransferase [Pseudomonadota bacterium]
MRKKLLARIAADGPMRFDEFMDRCLYDLEDGFFGSGDLRSNSDGDFVTSPEVSPWFGSLLGRWAV